MQPMVAPVRAGCQPGGELGRNRDPGSSGAAQSRRSHQVRIDLTAKFRGLGYNVVQGREKMYPDRFRYR